MKDNKTYSIEPLNKQDDYWRLWNGPESKWFWIVINHDDENGFGVTQIGPLHRFGAEDYIERCKKRDRRNAIIQRLKAFMKRAADKLKKGQQ